MLYYILQKQAIVKEKEELVDWRILKVRTISDITK
jgi:hypothetical protein